MNLSEKDRTFLALKYGPGYLTQLIDKWHQSEEDNFTDLERKIVLDWHRRIAGLATPEVKGHE